MERAIVVGDDDWIKPEDLELRRHRQDRTAMATESQQAVDALTWLQSEILRFAASRGEVRRRDVIARWHTSEGVARRLLAELVRRGFLRRLGRGRGTRYVRP